jgi:hypothetical protein
MLNFWFMMSSIVKWALLIAPQCGGEGSRIWKEKRADGTATEAGNGGGYISRVARSIDMHPGGVHCRQTTECGVASHHVVSNKIDAIG